MAILEVYLTNPDLKSELGSDVPALRGSGASILTLDSASQTVLQRDGSDWIAKAPGLMIFEADVAWYVLFFSSAASTPSAPAQGSGLLVRPNGAARIFSYRKGDKMIAAPA